MSRIDIIGQNGNEGDHYLVETVARMLAGDSQDKVLMGVHRGKTNWELFIPKAIEVIDVIKQEIENAK